MRSAAVVVRGGSLLVISRFKDGRSYCVLPGGGVEQGESLRMACHRELLEETGLDGTVGNLLDVPVDSDVPAVNFQVRVNSEALMLGGVELERESPANRYEPRWVDVDSLAELPLVPDAAALVLDKRR
ncbi:NUDIX domain-containing protein [Curtobacterium sp. MCPF17_002]|uniref:NUDIX domain-containing protein n=1 Tax=Curtobacterium sp. MCPF17_002 TaxID=2175645 RepID=UPI0015E88EE9|nr:NUDIX domain-containing protein [Curtobacterium sp. MCPF17_002]WIB76693.1 NUDIX domain-containing protein [Curtobacterium sp. MCPF17_002]